MQPVVLQGTSTFSSDCWGLSCLLQFLTWLLLSDYRTFFGTLKDVSLLINSLASNNCFSYRNFFQNGVEALSKLVDAFLSKKSKLTSERSS